MKEKTDKLNIIKIKNFCFVIDDIKKMRRQATESKKKLNAFNKGCYPKYKQKNP